MTDPSPSRMSPRRWFIVLFVAVTLGVAGFSVWSNLARWHSNDAALAQSLPPGVVPEKLSIAGHAFTVEVMRTDAERAKGLMFRRMMPPSHGMLFDFKADIPVAMWMKNTYLSLDMLFIKADGAIHRIERRTEPMSERTIAAGAPVRAVLELNGGVADMLGLKPGDKVMHPMFPAK